MNVGLLKKGLLFFGKFIYLWLPSLVNYSLKKIQKHTQQKIFQETGALLAVESLLWLETLLWKVLFKFSGLVSNCWKMTICTASSKSYEYYLVTYSWKIDNNPTQSPVQLTDCEMVLKTYFCWMESWYLNEFINVKQKFFCILKQFSCVVAIW